MVSNQIQTVYWISFDDVAVFSCYISLLIGWMFAHSEHVETNEHKGKTFSKMDDCERDTYALKSVRLCAEALNCNRLTLLSDCSANRKKKSNEILRWAKE